MNTTPFKSRHTDRPLVNNNELESWGKLEIEQPSSPKGERHVAFKSDKDVKIIDDKPLRQDDIGAKWYTRQEIDSMLKQCEIDASKATDEQSLRGLEFFTSEGRNKYQHIVRNNVKAILEQQSCPEKFNKEDVDCLHQLYRQRSAYRQRIAHLQALRDSQECGNDNSFRENNNSDKRSVKLVDKTIGHVPDLKAKHSSIRHAMRLQRVQREFRRRENQSCLDVCQMAS